MHEIKKSNKTEEAHRWQLKFYLYMLEKKGIKDVRGILEYPALRLREEIELNKQDRIYLSEVISEIKRIYQQDAIPPCISKKICRSCSYFDFCWSGEENTDGF